MFRFIPGWRRHATPGDARAGDAKFGDATPGDATPGDATPRHAKEPLVEYNTGDARDLFSHLVRRVRRGEEIVIAHAGVPVAKLVPYAGDAPRRPGVIRAQVVLRDDGRPSR